MIKKLIRLFLQTLKPSDPIVKELRRIPRYQESEVLFLGHRLKFPDSASVLFTYDEIFRKQIYAFQSNKRSPFIIDAGANVGISVIFFKQIFQESEILAFEPDKRIFSFLSANIAEFQLQNVTLINKGLWNSEQELSFDSEGADAGRISSNPQNPTTIKVMSLRQHLAKTVDFLKIDIEGAETVVLKDCADLLHNVENIFVEYHSFVGQEQELPELLLTLKNAGFRLNINTPALKSKSPFVRREVYNGMDMQLNIYGFRN
jgi:FkbM family methyltransferase